MSDMAMRDTGARDSELDERQRLELYAASHKTLRVTLFALLAAMLVVNVVTDDIVPTLALFGVFIATMTAHSLYARKSGIESELEEIDALERARGGLLTKQTVRLAVVFLIIQITGLSRGGLTLTEILDSVAGAALGALLLSWIEWRWARRKARLIETGSETADFERGRSLGRWLARRKS
jgi:hypothetical protein